MNSYYGRVILITGASSGIGKAVGESLARQGFRVYGTSRNPNQAAQHHAERDHATNTGFLKLVKLDVCDNTSVEEAVKYVLKAEGRIDILINNAGFAIAGPIEETSLEEAYEQINTNFFGTMRMCRNIIPIMRKQNKGLIINIGSVIGLISLPFQAMYGASKYALEAYTESLRIEVKPFGIRAVIIEPGDTKTGLTGNRYICKEAKDSSYGKRFTRSIEKMIHDEENGPGPEQITRIITKLVKQKNPPVRVTVGYVYKIFALLKRLLPARLVEFILEKMYA